MNEVSYKKSEIALFQLRGAITLFNEEDYVSSLTLAGASNEIITKLLRMRGLQWSHHFPAETREEMKKQTSKLLEKYIKTILNKTRNELKHHDTYEDTVVVADFYFEAEMFILSTIENYKILFGGIPEDKIVTDFYNEFSV